MANLPPDNRTAYTDAERALIAGYLLRKARGVDKALGSADHAAGPASLGWGDGTAAYYRHARDYSDFLLYWIGYPQSARAQTKAQWRRHRGRGGARGGIQ